MPVCAAGAKRRVLAIGRIVRNLYTNSRDCKWLRMASGIVEQYDYNVIEFELHSI